MKSKKGVLIVVSGPSGSGKGTICSELKKIMADVEVSVSATTRKPREEDAEGKSYYFKTVEQFEQMIENGELLEWVKYCDNYYGTPKRNIEEKLEYGLNVILEIEVTGALNVKNKFPDSILIFVVPPKYGDLIERLRNRGSEEEEDINKRINKAIDEIKSIDSYDYIVVNDTIPAAVMDIQAIINAEKNKTGRNKYIIEKFLNTLKEAKLND